MLNPKLVTSASLAGANNALSIPGPVSLSGASYAAGGSDSFDVSSFGRLSFQAFVTGSNVTGSLALQQSNNLAGWVTLTSQSLNSANVSQDVLLVCTANATAFARLMWSGSAGVSSSISVAVAGMR